MPIPEKVFYPNTNEPSIGQFYASLLKSLLRIAAGVALIWHSIALAGVLLILAELLKIIEDMI